MHVEPHMCRAPLGFGMLAASRIHRSASFFRHFEVPHPPLRSVHPSLLRSWDSLAARLYPLLTEDVVRCFNGSDFKVSDLLFSKEPITIYLRWHEADLLALSPLIKFVWEAMINELITAYDLAP